MKTYIIMLAIALTSCHILTKNKSTSKKLTQKEELQLTAQHHTLSKQNKLFLTDSSHSDFTVWLWPKGNFTFSPTKGFNGEAERIVVKGKQTHQKTLNITNELKQDSTVIKANYQHLKQQSAIAEKTKLNFGPSWAWLLLVPIFCLGYFA